MLFRPPKKGNKKAWELVKYLISEGFIFQHIYKEGKSAYFKTEKSNYVEYPSNMEEAKIFVSKYKSQMIKND